MSNKSAKLLTDIVVAGAAIERFTRGLTRHSYSSNLLVRSAVERQFVVLGEALRRLASLDAALAEQISEYRRIITFRNIIVHGYDAPDTDVVWQAVTDKVPILAGEAQQHLVCITHKHAPLTHDISDLPAYLTRSKFP